MSHKTKGNISTLINVNNIFKNGPREICGR